MPTKIFCRATHQFASSRLPTYRYGFLSLHNLSVRLVVETGAERTAKTAVDVQINRTMDVQQDIARSSLYRRLDL